MPRSFKFSQINAGKVNLRGKSNLSHNVTTTCDFGQVQPLFTKLMSPGSRIKGNLKELVRVMPMPLPPFGKVNLHTYGQFVPVSSLYKAFPEFVAGQMYSSSTKTYVPDKLPSLPVYGPISIMSQLFSEHNAIWSVFPITLEGTDNPSNDFNGIYWHFSTLAELRSKTGAQNKYFTNYQPGVSLPSTEVVTSQPACPPCFSLTELNMNMGFQYSNPVNVSSRVSHNGLGAAGLTLGQSGFDTGDAPSSNIYPGLSSYNDFQTVLDSGISLSPDTCDFLVFIKDLPLYGSDGSTAGTPSYIPIGMSDVVVTISLTKQGRQLAKVLRGVGIQPNMFDTREVEILRLFAVYKSYFDIFFPLRDIQWSQTYAYKLLDWCSETGKPLTELPSSLSSPVGILTLNYFFSDLADMFATCDPNYFTSAVLSPNPTSNDTVGTDFSSNPEDSSSDYKNGWSTNNVISGSGAEPKLQLSQAYGSGSTAGSVYTYLTRNGLRLLNNFSKFVNTNTVIGRSLDAYFKAHFDGYKGRDENSAFQGASVTEIQLGDTIVTSDSGDRNPGDFAGVGYGKGGYAIDVRTKDNEFGYFIVLASVIPVANYVQGSSYDAFITKRFELPTPEFDGIGYDKVCVGELLATNTRLIGYDAPNLQGQKTFGYQPRYTGYKVQKSLVNGDVALRSTRDNYLGFTLDNYISTDVCTVKPQSGNSHLSYLNANPRPSLFVAGSYWRWLGRYQFLSNYRRIFYDSSVVKSAFQVDNVFDKSGQAVEPDGFVLYCDFDLKFTGNFKSISSVYDTLEGSDNYVQHE